MSAESSTTATTPTTLKPTPLIQTRVTDRLADFPWWVLILILLAAALVYMFITDATYNEIIVRLLAGISLTIWITINAFILAMIIGLLTAFGQMSRNPVARNIATLYVQIVRGIPTLVLILYIAIAIVPLFAEMIQNLGDWMASMGWIAQDNPLSNLNQRNISFTVRGIIALAINYGAFSSEIFRSGIQSIEKGQVEASRALGLTWYQSMRFVVLPQAFRRILPPLGNDFISMLKESSLLSALGVNEITQLGKKDASASFLYLETYSTLAFLYLSMTLILSMGVKYMEKRLKTGD
jgi:polar amino acid transport system permease protein